MALSKPISELVLGCSTEESHHLTLLATMSAAKLQAVLSSSMRHKYHCKKRLYWALSLFPSFKAAAHWSVCRNITVEPQQKLHCVHTACLGECFCVHVDSARNLRHSAEAYCSNNGASNIRASVAAFAQGSFHYTDTEKCGGFRCDGGSIRASAVNRISVRE